MWNKVFFGLDTGTAIKLSYFISYLQRSHEKLFSYFDFEKWYYPNSEFSPIEIFRFITKRMLVFMFLLIRKRH